MKPAYTATTCSNHKRKRQFTCGCPLYCYHGVLNLYSEKQVNQLLEENKTLRHEIGDWLRWIGYLPSKEQPEGLIKTSTELLKKPLEGKALKES